MACLHQILNGIENHSTNPSMTHAPHKSFPIQFLAKSRWFPRHHAISEVSGREPSKEAAHSVSNMFPHPCGLPGNFRVFDCKGKAKDEDEKSN